MMRTPSLHLASVSALMKPWVSGVFGRCSVMKSPAASTSSGDSAFSAPISRKRSCADERVERDHAHAEGAGADRDQLADAAEAEHAERLALDLGAAELRALPLAAMRLACACGMLRASASISATVCSAAATVLASGALATMIPRLDAAATSTLSTPTPARPTTRQVVGAVDHLGVELGRGADQDAVVAADPRPAGRRGSSRCRDRRRSARAACRRRCRRSSPRRGRGTAP